MDGHEDLQLICDLLAKTLQVTDEASDLVALKYKTDELDEHTEKDTVTAVFQNGIEIVADVTCNSGTALIYNVMRQIFL